MSVLTNIRYFDSVIEQFLESPRGPVAEEVLRPGAEEVVRQADVNASGSIIGIESGQLSAGIRYDIRSGTEGLEAIVGTDAKKNGFSYPAWQDRFGGRPWLTSALQSVFPDVVVLVAGRS